MKTILPVLILLLSLMPSSAQKISSLTEMTVVSPANLLAVAVDGGATYKVTFGSLITNLELYLTTTATVTNAVATGSNLATTNATTFGVYFAVTSLTNMQFFSIKQGTNMVIYRDGSNIVINATSTTISNTHLIFVDTAGDNASALKGRRDRPYLTPVAAKAAATAGDTIVVFPGQYDNATNLFKGGVNWLGYGATLTYTNRTNDGGVGIFDDRWSGAITSSVKGFSFRYSTGYETTNATYDPAHGPTNTAGCLVITNSRSQVLFEFDRIDYQDVRSSSGYAACLWLRDGTNCFIKGTVIQDMNLTTNYSIGFNPDLALDVSVESVAIGIYWSQGEHHIDIKRIVCKRNSVYGSGAIVGGNFWLTSDYLYGQYYGAGPVGVSNWRMWADIKELESNRTNSLDAGVITIGFAGKFYLRAEKVTELGTATAPNGGIGINQLSASPETESWIDIQKLSAGLCWVNCQSGTMHANIGHFEDLGFIDKGINVIGGKLFLSGLEAVVTNSTGSAFYHGAGDAALSGIRLSATNSSASPAILGTNGAVLQNCTLLSKATVYSLYATNTRTANIQGCWGRTGETNVSYLVGPWTVDSNVR